METQIKFTQWQIEEVLFREMVKSHEVSNVAHLIQLQPHYENNEIMGINVIAKEKNNPSKEVKITFNLHQIEALAFKEMVYSKEIPNTQHSIKIDFNIDKKNNVVTILSLNATAKELQKSLISKILPH